MITYKFRLYPNKKQEQKLLWTLDKCRFVYNKMLEGLNEQDKPNRLELQNSIPKLKEKHPDLKEVYSKVLQYESYKLFSNLKALAWLKKNGKKVGKLRFKKEGWFKTLVYNQSGFKLVKTNKRLDKLHLSKIGDVPIRIHREVKGEIKQIIVKKCNSGKWFACVCVEDTDIENRIIERGIGIDVGIEYFLTDSDGLRLENPKYLGKSYEKLKKEQRKLSKKKNGSKNYKKQKMKVARIHEKIVNQRNDFLHKLSKYYIDNYDFISVEDLNIKNMLKYHHIAGDVEDASWNRFIQFLSYKAERAGKIVVKVNPKGTSQEHNYKKLDRDYNASLNILQRGMKKIGRGQAEFTPVETEPLQVIPASSVVESGSSFIMSVANR